PLHLPPCPTRRSSDLCSLASLPSNSLDNTVTVSWGTQFLPDDGWLVGNNSPDTVAGISFTNTNADNCATVKDTFNNGSPNTLGEDRKSTRLNSSHQII